MKKLLVLIALAGLITLPAEASVQLAGETHAQNDSVQGDASVIVLVRDASGKQLFRNSRDAVTSSTLGLLAGTGVQALSLDFLKTAEKGTEDVREAKLATLSPAEAMELSGADYALVLQLAAPLETPRGGTIYSRQSVSYTLFAATGKAVDSGRASKIFDAPVVDDSLREIRIVEVAELAIAELEKKIAAGKVVLKKSEATQVGETEIVAVVEAMKFPQVIEHKDGSFSIEETDGTVTMPGVTLKIGGLDYTLAADGSPTKIKLPLGRPLFISATHRDIEPLNRTIKLEKSGEKIVLPLTLSKAARERWKKDLAEISTIVGMQKITAAEATRLRGIAKFWENSGMKITSATTHKIKISRKTQTEIIQTEEVPAEIKADDGAE